MLSHVFRVHGHLCAQHPWEVIIGTVSFILCFLSMRAFSPDDTVCGWDFKCTKEISNSSDVILFTMTKCVSVFYMYLQFRFLRKLGSVYLLGIACVFTIVSSFVFSIAVVNLIGGDFTDLNEAFPFFLLLSDLSKSTSLAKFALCSKSHEEVKENIGNGMAIIGPALTLDAVVEILVIGIGTISGVRQLEMMSCFGCLSVAANYLAFMTFYPACLTLVLELCREHIHGKPVWQLQQSAKTILEEEEHKKPNPVTQHVKIIMSMGLVLVHGHVRWTYRSEQSDYLKKDLVLSGMSTESNSEQEISSVEAYLTRLFAQYAEHIITLVLAVFLIMKYSLYDDSDDKFDEQMMSQSQLNLTEQNQQMCNFSESVETEVTDTCVKFQSVSKGENDNVQNPFQECECRQSSKREPLFSISYDDSSSDDECYMSKVNKSTQTVLGEILDSDLQEPRSLEECLKIMNSDDGAKSLTDKEILVLVKHKYIPAYKLENMLEDYERGVNIRRSVVCHQLENRDSMRKLPYEGYEYKYVNGACCENVIGYIPMPVGYAGPLLLNGSKYFVPMATTEGCLVASTNRGCRALEQSGGVESTVIHDGMSRGPVVRFTSAKKASEAKFWLEEKYNFNRLKESFDGTSRFARLIKIQTAQAGKHLFIRFVAKTGDAMGMNMVSKGSERALKTMSEEFPEMDIISLSGNYCTDKKPSAINWIEGRGKSVVCEAVVPAKVVKSLLKTSVPDLIQLNISKNYIGSAMAGSLGGFNAHASNIVTAVFIATGQDPAQNVTSSNCITILEATGENNEDLYISCTMPSIEIGTIGGGTVLPPQAACLQMLGLNGSCQENPGENARKLASIVCGTVLAGELSLLSALAAGHLVRSHLTHNRSSVNMSSGAVKPSPSNPETEKHKEITSKEPS